PFRRRNGLPPGKVLNRGCLKLKMNDASGIKGLASSSISTAPARVRFLPESGHLCEQRRTVSQIIRLRILQMFAGHFVQFTCEPTEHLKYVAIFRSSVFN